MNSVQKTLDRKLVTNMSNGFANEVLNNIKAGANLSKINVNKCVIYFSNYVPLISVVADKGDLSLMEQMIAHGGNVNVIDEMGMTPLMYAVRPITGDVNLELVKYLLDNGADINARRNFSGYEESVLMRAVKYADIDVARFLLNNGAGQSVSEEDISHFEKGLEIMNSLKVPDADGYTNFNSIMSRYLTVLDMLKEALSNNKETELQ